MSTASNFDVIVIGAGHNGLTLAAYLAKKNKKVLLVEKRADLGGIASGHEFHKGYRTVGLLHDTSQVRGRVIRDLELQKHGLNYDRTPPPVFAPTKNGKGILLHQDAEASAAEISAYSKHDAEQYKKYRAFFRNITPFVEKIFDDVAPNVYGLNFYGLWDLMKKGVSLRLMGRKDMMEILRIGPMCVADWLNEWFETDVLKALLAGPAVFGNYTGPWSPSTNANLIVHECMSRLNVHGGPQALVTALTKACQRYGVTIRTNCEVERINVSDEQINGIRLANGEEIKARAVVATCDPKQTFLKLMDTGVFSFTLETRVEQYRARGTTAKVHLALNRPLEFACRPGFYPEFVRTGEHVDELERAFDPIKYGEYALEPALDIRVPTVSDPSLAPHGHHVASILVNYAPYDLRAGWSEEEKKRLGEVVIAKLETYAPGIRNSVVASEVLTPADLEKEYNLSNGHILHGEHAADQILMRPTPETAQYKTPFKGLYLGGSGSHPGGGITCAPGSLAAQVVLHG